MRKNRASFGVYFPTRTTIWPLLYGEKGLDAMLDFAEQAEEFGYDSIWVGDSLIAKPRYDSLVTLAAMCGRTHRVKLGTCCFGSFPLREPIALAHTWASLDHYSKGRMILAVCVGGGGTLLGGAFEDEYRIFGIPVKARAEILEEKIGLLRKLWTGQKTSYHGKYLHYDDVQLDVKPVQNLPPIWIASNPFAYADDLRKVERPFRRVARLADGWLTISTAEVFSKGWEIIQNHAREIGRQRELVNAIFHGIVIDDDKERGYAAAKDFLDRYYSANLPKFLIDRWVTYGSRGQCISSLEDFINRGVQNFVIRFPCSSAHRQFEEFNKEILTSF